MKLSSKGRYAVMALADLAKFDPNEPVSLRDISLRQGISLVYLEQLFLRLKKNNIVNSVRGMRMKKIPIEQTQLYRRIQYLTFTTIKDAWLDLAMTKGF